MPYDLRVLCRPEVAAGFALAGLRPVEAATPREGSEQLSGLLEDSDIGVVLMEQELFDRLPDATRRRIERRALPLIVPFPGPAWTASTDNADAYVTELLRQVIGYRVRIR